MNLSDGDGTWGLIEMIFVYGVALGIAGWQLYSVNKTLKASDEEKSSPPAAEGEHALDPPTTEQIER